ncbi:MAG: radical SAM protein [Chitinispirillaceae bacterium]|nr:radical SAM protein [Chitinispirillaceae bacterium]
MTPTRRFNKEMLHSLIRSIRLLAGFRPAGVLSVIRWLWVFMRAAQRRGHYAEAFDVAVPPLIILSATMRCNLHCSGCYSRNFSLNNELPLASMDRLFSEARTLGVSMFVMTGGEPLLLGGLLNLLARHRDLLFLLFNNATLLDAGAARQIGASHNIIPMLSIEGNETMTDQRRGSGMHRTVLATMDLLKREHAFFGFSTMVTTNNIALMHHDSFYDDLIQRGCRIGLLVGYVPAAGDAPLDCLPSVEAQRALRKRVRELQHSKQLILMQMPEDEYEQTGACLAAGKGFVHINAHGYVEPCPFFHWSTHTIQGSTLKQALASPWLRHIRTNTNFTDIPHKGCALFEHRSELQTAATSMGVIDTESAFKEG